MIGWFGDANGYVGNADLKPETANTVSATFDWHDANQQDWEVKLTPYFTYVQDYIGVNRIGTFNPGADDTKAILQFVNQNAQFYGIDMAWKHSLWDNSHFGKGRLTGLLGYNRGEQSNGDELYHIMPLNIRMSLEQKKGAWANAIDVQLVDRKSQVDGQRFELKTAGYTLLNLRTAYQMQKVRLDFSITNLLDKFYNLPLGGVDYADWNAKGAIGEMVSVAGVGRSVNLGVTIDFD
jgi:iron complex outermembrane receptor protein